MEGRGVGSLSRCEDHEIREAYASPTIAAGCTGHVVRSLHYNAVGGNQLNKHVRNLGTGEPIGPFQYPDHLNRNFAAYESRVFRGQPFQQCSCGKCLLNIVIHEVPNNYVGVYGNHESDAPSMIARSMSSSVTASPVCRNTPNSRAMGRTGTILTSPSWIM